MVKYVIVADDLTGSNATCSLLKKIGLRAASVFQLSSEKMEEMDVISYSTDSRGITKEEAYERVKRAINVLKRDEILLYNKRIDSTLRGNIGAEIDAMLEQLERSEEHTSELQSRQYLVCRLLLEKKKKTLITTY